MLNYPGSGPSASNSGTAATALDALGDPTRRAILEQLSRGPASVTDLATPLKISRSAVMQHLSVLEKGELVSTEKRGRVRHCELNTTGFAAAKAWLEGHQRRWEQRLSRLGEELAEDET